MQLGWPHLLPITLHLHASRAALALGRPLPDLLEEEVGASVFNRLVSISESKLPPSRPLAVPARGAPAVLERYLAEVGEELEHRFADQLQTSHAPLIHAAGRGAGSDLCTRCAATGGPQSHQCSFRVADGKADEVTLRERGLCLDPVRELFEYSAGLALRLYGLSRQTAPELILETGHRPKRNALLDTAVFGSIHEADARGPRRRRIVKILISTDRWQPLDYLSLLAVLFHECFVHGVCGVDVDDVDAKPFHEGWMDCVGVAMLRAEMAHLSSHPEPPPESQAGRHVAYVYRSEFMAQMELLHERRYGASPSTFPEVASYEKGRRALRALRQMLVLTLLGTFSDVEVRVETILARMSLALNADAGWVNEERARFVTALVANFARTTHALVAKACEDHGATPWLEQLAADPQGGALIFSRRIQSTWGFTSKFN